MDRQAQFIDRTAAGWLLYPTNLGAIEVYVGALPRISDVRIASFHLTAVPTLGGRVTGASCSIARVTP